MGSRSVIASWNITTTPLKVYKNHFTPHHWLRMDQNARRLLAWTSGLVFYLYSSLLKLSKLWDPTFNFNYLKQIHFPSQSFENLLKQGTLMSAVSPIPDLGLSQMALMNIVTHKTVKTGLHMKIRVILFQSLYFCILLFSFQGHCDVTPQVHIPVTSPAHCFVTLKLHKAFWSKMKKHTNV